MPHVLIAVAGTDNRSGEIRRQFEEYALTRDPQLRERLVIAHLPLARSLARRYANRGEALDDLVQVASLALVKAIERFDVSRDSAFTTFATPTIAGELKRHFRDKGWAMRVPRRLQELHMEVADVVALLTHRLGRSPTVAEIAAEARLGEDEVLEATEVGGVYRIASFDAPRRDAADDTERMPAVAARDSGFEQSESRLDLDALLALLPERERRILRMRFYEDKTQSEIGTELGISQVHVSRLISQSIRRIRELSSNPRAALEGRPMDLDLSVTENEGAAVIRVNGEVDLYTAPRLRQQILDVVNSGTLQVIIDLDGVAFLDSTGLGVLVGALKRLRQSSGELSLVCTRAPILKVFEITSLTSVFAIHESVEAAQAPSAAS